MENQLRFIVREHTRDIKGSPGHPDHKDYWICVSKEMNDYYEALKWAIAYEKNGGYKCWVELISDEW
jgi:hypothetical protein